MYGVVVVVCVVADVHSEYCVGVGLVGRVVGVVYVVNVVGVVGEVGWVGG